jgi:hypothetical protein
MLATLAVLGLATAASFAQWSSPADEIPAYHAAPPAKGVVVPPIMSGAQLTGPNFTYPWQVAVYKIAARESRVIYQLPCYCRCDRALGHQSLHSCFEGTHGAECSLCAKEAVYAYRMTMKGKTVAQIRAGIEKREFETIDLDAIKS